MLISKKNKFIFIHIPKTAGTSLRAMLYPYTEARPGLINFLIRRINKLVRFNFLFFWRTYDAHTTLEQLYNFIPEKKIKAYHKFCVVRNPYSRLVSFYEHILRNKHHPWHTKIADYGSFEVMVDNLHNVGEPSQNSYIKDKLGEINIDQILFFESLSEQIDLLSKRLVIPIKLVHKNSGKRSKKWQSYYNSIIAKKVYDHYKEDFDLFNYTSNI